MTYQDELELYKLKSGTNAWGGAGEELTLTGKIKGNVLVLSGNEAFVNGKFREQATHIIFIPYRLVVNAGDRIIYQGRIMNVLQTQKHGAASKHKQQQLICEEIKVNQG